MPYFTKLGIWSLRRNWLWMVVTLQGRETSPLRADA
jgi:hypothetical protein